LERRGGVFGGVGGGGGGRRSGLLFINDVKSFLISNENCEKCIVLISVLK
jgi:hypothetical protein